jgi:hypothetical protein
MLSGYPNIKNSIVLLVKKIIIIKNNNNKNITNTKYQIQIKFNTNQFDYLI